MFQRSKYRNRKIVFDNIKFDSKKEAEKYCELMLLKNAGRVIDFTCQPKFEIIPGFEKDGVKYRATHYIADFDVTYIDGRREIIDIKPFNKTTGKYFLLPLFKLKARLFDSKYPHLTLVIE